MKKYIKISFLIILVVSVFSLLVVSVSAAPSGTCGDNLAWELNDKGTLTISGTGDMDNFSPTHSSPWDSFRGRIKTVVIESGVTSIGDYAFEYCESLESITIPEGVTSIGDSAFSDCRSLESITIPEGVTSIGDYAFYWCTSLKNITLPEGVKSIGEDAFQACTSLESIIIPEGVTSIGDYAFDGCTSLESITIPEGVTSIGNYAFYDCNSLTSITIPDSITSIGDGAFECCESLTSITLPEGVTSIGDRAFYGCRNLASITLPEGVTSIGVDAFHACESLASIIIPEGVTSIGDYAFEYCESLESITLPEGVTSIGVDAFHACESLASIIIPEGVTSIGDYAFEYCESLESITIPEGVTSIGERVFYGCESLTIYGFAGSAAETYASENNIPFVKIASETKVEGISLDKTTLSLAEGKSDVLTARLLPDNATNKNVTWNSSDANVASVLNGVVTAKKAGTAIITATTEDGGYQATCVVTVTEGVEPMIVYVSDVCARAGDTVTVDLELRKNPGVLGMQYSLAYDETLTLTGVEASEMHEILTFTPPGDFSANPVTLVWDGLEEYTANGVILSLTFKVSEAADEGFCGISLIPVDVYNESGDVEVTVINGGITVEAYLPGDINGDGSVSARDVTALRRYIAGGYPDNKVVDEALDVNRDGSVTARDVTHLRRFIAGGYEITLK